MRLHDRILLALAVLVVAPSIFCSDCSRWHGFYRKSIDERMQLVRDQSALHDEQIEQLCKSLNGCAFIAGLGENTLAAYALPFSIAPYFIVNGISYTVPMVTEEKTVVAAASLGAKLARTSGGFTAHVCAPIAISQIVLTHVPDMNRAQQLIVDHKSELLAYAQDFFIGMQKRGGGLTDLSTRVVQTARGGMLSVDLQVNTCDAMGANSATRIAQYLAPKIARLTGGTVLMGIISNLAIKRIAYARAVWQRAVLGDACIQRILDAYALACADPFRCVTHNKGIMNGIDAVALATGNDFRALEAGAHAYAAFGHPYQPLTRYYTNEQGDLVGEIELPLAVGIVGGTIGRHPMAQLAIRLLQIKTSDELACVMASVGLAQNFAALRALVGEGITHAFS